DGIRYLIVTGVQTCALPIFDLEGARRLAGVLARAAAAARRDERHCPKSGEGPPPHRRRGTYHEAGALDAASMNVRLRHRFPVGKIGRASGRERAQGAAAAAW